MTDYMEGANYKWKGDEKGYVWEDDGKYKNLVDRGSMWYLRISFICFIISIVITVVWLAKLDGDLNALKQAIVAKRTAFWHPATAAPSA